MNNDYLMHHGVKRMEWGKRRYQNEDGSLTPLGRIHYGVGQARIVISKAANKVRTNVHNAKEAAQNKKIAKQKAEAEAKQKAEAEAKQKAEAEAKAAEEAIEKAKNDAISSGDPDKIVEFANRMSTAELNEALTRAKTISNIRALGGSNKGKDNEEPQSAVDTIKGNVADVAKKAGKGVGGLAVKAALQGGGTLLNKMAEGEEDESKKKILSFFGKKLKEAGTGEKIPEKIIEDSSFESIDVSNALEAAKKMTPEKRVEYAQYLNSLKMVSDAAAALKGGDDKSKSSFESFLADPMSAPASQVISFLGKNNPMGNVDKLKEFQRETLRERATAEMTSPEGQSKMNKYFSVPDVGSWYRKTFESPKYKVDSNNIVYEDSRDADVLKNIDSTDSTNKRLNAVRKYVDKFLDNEPEWSTDKSFSTRVENKMAKALDKIGDFDLFAYIDA